CAESGLANAKARKSAGQKIADREREEIDLRFIGNPMLTNREAGIAGDSSYYPSFRVRETWARTPRIHELIAARACGVSINPFTFPRAVTTSCLWGAVSGFGHVAVRSDAGLGVHAPEQAVIGTLHVGVGLGQDELTLPAQRGAQIRVIRIEAIAIANHAAPPAAFRMARFTATRASWTLYAFWLSGLALASAASAAFLAVSSFTFWPFRAAAAAGGIQGMGATCPITMRAG